MSDDSIKGGQVTEMAYSCAPYWGGIEESREHHSLHEPTEDRGVKTPEGPSTTMDEAETDKCTLGDPADVLSP